jgi:hypothetical protein
MLKLTPPAMLGVAFALAALSGCSADVGDGTAVYDDGTVLNTATLEVESPTNLSILSAGEVVLVKMKAEGVVLVDPDDTPPPDVASFAAHVAIFLDSTDNPPLARTADDKIDVVIPTSTYTGEHKLICQLSSHDGTATHATAELPLTVKWPACVN